MHKRPVKDQTVVITGAAQGLGRAVARIFHHTGAKVALMDIDHGGLNTLAHGLGERAKPYPVDLADAATTRTAIEKVLVEQGPVHTLLHNAAILVPEPFEGLSFERWQATVNVGIQAAFLLTQAVWEGMKKAGGGCVIYVSSRAGIEGHKDESAYCTAKHGLEGLMKSLAEEGKPDGILVHTITPGMYMHTPMSERNYTSDLKQKWVDPALLAPAFLYLAELKESLSGQRLNAWELSQSLRG